MKNREAKSLSVSGFFRQFPDDAAAERWFIENRWPNGIVCPHCSSDNVQERTTHKTMPHRCRDCRRFFSVKTDSLMHRSKLGYQTWLFGIYLMATSKKGISSLDLADKLGVPQKTAWYLSHRIRSAYKVGELRMTGTVEADETYVGGIDRNRHADRKGKIPKLPVVGVRCRETGEVRTAPGQRSHERDRELLGAARQGLCRNAPLVQPQARLALCT